MTRKYLPASCSIITDVDKQAMRNAVDAGWLTSGPLTDRFEAMLAKQFGTRFASVCNSGSSANLLAVAAMVEAGYWRAGDEILTVACAFPTTVNPLLLYGLVPVFVDIDPMTLNVDCAALRNGLSAKTKGIMLAHTLGNPFDLDSIMDLARACHLRVIEDCCDALGSTYKGQHVGSFGDIATCSFFPAHHITTGEGGAVMTSNPSLHAKILSVRDWGRDCYCIPGKENTCGKRFEHSFKDLPQGYDHKYTYTAIGFNLKSTEIAASLGVEQFNRLPEFIRARRNNRQTIARRLANTDSIQIVQETKEAGASWFGFPFTIKAEGERTALQQYLETCGIGSRLVFSGNITRQPYMRGRKYRIAGSLKHTDKVMNDALWVGVWPGLTDEDMEYIAEKIKGFFA